MPPRCLEKGQLSSRIMREVLQSGGAGGWESMQGGEHVGRACRGGYIADHLAARGYIWKSRGPRPGNGIRGLLLH